MTSPATAPWRITIDASLLAYPRKTGIARYLEALLPRLARLAGSKAAFTLLAGGPIRHPTALGLLAEGVVRARTFRSPSLHLWQQLGMGLQIGRCRAEAHLAPEGLLPLGVRCPTVGVVHDLIWARVPGAAAAHVRLVFRLRQRRSLKRFDVAFADSEFTRRDCLRAFGPVAERLEVLPLGVDLEVFRPLAADEAESAARFRARLGLPERFLLAVGNPQRHKNLGRVLEAVARLDAQGAPRPMLAIVGVGGLQQLRSAGPSARPDRVRWIASLEDDDMAWALRTAEAMIFPSLYEGFGLPVLEAMASGTPVLYSGRASLPEVAGEAGLVFDAEDPSALAEAIRRLLGDPALRAELGRRGRARAEQLSWDRHARRCWEALAELAERRRARNRGDRAGS